MNDKRLVRISLTLFVAASVLIFLVTKRLERARTLIGDAAETEIRMSYLGLAMAGLMLAAGMATIITALVRSRRKPALKPPQEEE